MLKENNIEITINGTTAKWYSEKGYNIPKREVQLYYKNKKGEKSKNGKSNQCKNGTKILVKIEDLHSNSNQSITFVCEECKNDCTTSWGAYQNKKTNLCTSCQKKTIKTVGGCHGYWVDKLISSNHDACCDISGEPDKRFLILHHLLSTKIGGKDEKSNYVILSSNYHIAFHRWIGTQKTSTPDKYIKFKELCLIELKKKLAS